MSVPFKSALRKKVLAPFFVALVAFVFAAAIFLASVNLFLKPYLLGELSKYLKSEINCSFVWFRFYGGVRVVCRNVSAKNEFGEFLQAPLVEVPIGLSEVRKHRISFGEILILNPTIRVKKTERGFNISKLIAAVSKSSHKRKSLKLIVPAISLVKSRVYFTGFSGKSAITFKSADFSILLRQPGTKLILTAMFGKNPFTIIARHFKGWHISAKNRNVPLSKILDIVGIKSRAHGFLDMDLSYDGNFAGENLLNGNVFVRNLKSKIVSGGGQVFVKENKFFAELSGKDSKFSVSGIFNAGTFLFQNAFLKLPEVSAQFAGKLRGVVFSASGEFFGLRIKSKFFNGSLSGNFHADGLLNNLKKAVADVNITAASGSFPRLSFLYNTLQTLDVFNFLIGKFPKYKSEFPVDRITGNVKKSSSTVKISGVLVENSVSRTSIDGEVDLGRDSLNLIVGFQVQKLVNDVISKIPLVGYVLLGKRKSLIPVFLNVKGSFARPEVKPLPAKTIAGPVVGIIERTFKIPFKIFEAFGGKK